MLAGLRGFLVVSLLREFVFSGGLAVDLAYSVLLGVIYIGVIYVLKLDSEDLYVLRAVAHKLRLARLGTVPAN